MAWAIRSRKFILNESPGRVFCKRFVDSEEVEFDLLRDPTKLPPNTLPPIINPAGLDLERKKYLYKETRPFCKPNSADHETVNLVENVSWIVWLTIVCDSKWRIWAIRWVLRWLLLHVMRRSQGLKAYFRFQPQADFQPEIWIARLPNRTPDKLKGWCFRGSQSKIH